MIMVFVYVNDLIYTRHDKPMFDNFKRCMMVEFDMSNLGLLHNFLGIKVTYFTKGIHVSQEKYVQEILDMFKINNYNLIDILMEIGMKLINNLEGKKIDNTIYKKFLKFLICLSTTKP